MCVHACASLCVYVLGDFVFVCLFVPMGVCLCMSLVCVLRGHFVCVCVCACVCRKLLDSRLAVFETNYRYSLEGLGKQGATVGLGNCTLFVGQGKRLMAHEDRTQIAYLIVTRCGLATLKLAKLILLMVTGFSGRAFF